MPAAAGPALALLLEHGVENGLSQSSLPALKCFWVDCANFSLLTEKAMAGSTRSCQPRVSVAVRTSTTRHHKKLLGAALGAVVAGFLLTAGQAKALTWNWSFSGDASSGQGTFTTAGSTPVAGAIETITDITGTYYRFDTFGGDGTYSIRSYRHDENTFKWDGPGGSPINSFLISFEVSGNSLGRESGIFYVHLFSSLTSGPNDYRPVTDTFTTFSGYDGVINSSSLSPVSPVANVPGPLPILGLAAAFGFSRKLRKRIKLHKGTSAVSTPPSA